MSIALPADSTTVVNLLVEYSSSEVRLVFHVYIGIVLLLIGIIGDRCCASRVKLQLFRGKSVRMTHMTGWLSNFNILKAMWNLEVLPAGWIGIFMLLTSILFIADTLVVATLIRTETVQTRCPFGTGMVISTAGPDSAPVYSKVPYNGAPAVVAARAQIVSQANGGLSGIYKKVNRSLKFSATSVDILGRWNCVALTEVLTFPFDEQIVPLVAKLYSAGLMYGTEATISSCYSELSTDSYSHIMVLDPSTDLEGYESFDVRVSVDLTGGLEESKKVMKTFECKISGNNVNNILERIYSAPTLNDWCQTFQGAVYNGAGTPARENTQSIIEENLNTLTMVAGGGDFLLNKTAATETQGCVVDRTTISWAVFGLIGATTVLLFMVLVCWLVLSLMISHSRTTYKNTLPLEHDPDVQEKEAMKKRIEEYTPGNVLEWMAQAARESKGRPVDRLEIKSKDLKTINYGLIKENSTARMGVHFNGPRIATAHAPWSTNQVSRNSIELVSRSSQQPLLSRDA